jgi:hypothetical protein
MRPAVKNGLGCYIVQKVATIQATTFNVNDPSFRPYNVQGFRPVTAISILLVEKNSKAGYDAARC